MERTTLELQIISAKHLKDVNFIGKMDVYVVVSLSGDSSSQQKIKTTVDRDGGTNPTWNFPMKFTVIDHLAQQDRLTIDFKLKCERLVGGDRDAGKVNVPVKEILDSAKSGSTQFVCYQVRTPSGKPQGALNFSYTVGDGQIPKLIGPGVGVNVRPTHEDHRATPSSEPVTIYPTIEPSIGPHLELNGPPSPYPPPSPYLPRDHRATIGKPVGTHHAALNLSYQVSREQVSKLVTVYPPIEPNGPPSPYPPPPGPYLREDHWATKDQHALNLSYQVSGEQVSKLVIDYPAIEHAIGPYMEPYGHPSPYPPHPGPYIPPPPVYTYPPPPGYGYLPTPPHYDYLTQGGHVYSSLE